MNINTLIKDMADAVAQDADLKSWSNTNYGRDHHAFLHSDGGDLPGENYCPCVLLVNEARTMGQDQHEKMHEIIAHCIVYDETYGTDDLIPNLIEYQGGRKVEDLRRLAMLAVAGAGIGDRGLRFEIGYDSLSQFPYFCSSMLIRVPESVTVGSDYLA